DLTGVVIGSVVPAATSSAVKMARRFCRLEPVVVGPGTRTGISIATDDPREVGADRVANAAAAYEQTGGPAIVVDFGTATTFDAVSRGGEYLGGAICPGVEVSAAALSSAAARLLDVELAAPRGVIGRTTSESLRSGIVLGTAAMVDGMTEKLNKELGGDAAVLATGGLAALIIEHCSTAIIHEPNLTLNGLGLLYERNAEAR
ncbi:MAG: type III pantothenate kinase, partial [Actinomycetota bacterium]